MTEDKRDTAKPDYDLSRAITEARVMERWGREILAKLPNPIPLRITPFSPAYTEHLMTGTNVSYMVSEWNPFHPSQNRIYYVPGATAHLTEGQIKASIAHEIGHIIFKHPELGPEENAQWIEYEADAFATRLGFGPDLISSMEEWFPVHNDIETNSHPSRSNRIKAIQEILQHVEIPAMSAHTGAWPEYLK